ncbi:hypothetical protein LZ31DRAFT_550655 [Colletotrichum somersetense]|nr:hypothetical protein LZ31DRAFT_550655 [Colletotrichum somersetense]
MPQPQGAPSPFLSAPLPLLLPVSGSIASHHSPRLARSSALGGGFGVEKARTGPVPPLLLKRARPVSSSMEEHWQT